MRIIYVCGRMPYPPMSGGQRDTFNRARAMRDLGHEIIIVSTIDSKKIGPDLSELNMIEKELGEVIFLPVMRTKMSKCLKVISLLRFPLLTVRIGRGASNRAIARLREFQPDIVWMDYIFMLPFVAETVRLLKVPVAMRSHNIEHRYRWALVRASNGVRARLMSWLRTISVRRLEMAAARLSSAILDISASDIAFWEQNFPDRLVRWLPPIFTFNDMRKKRCPKYEAAFLGSLATSTNIEGLKWYLEKVHPIVLARFSGFRLLIGGSSPDADFTKFLESIRGVELRRDVADPDEVWGAGKVLINPVLSGEGVNIKTVEMLGYDKFRVTTTVGVRGFPDVVRNAFMIADTPEAFAQALLYALSADYTIDYSEVRSQFSQVRLALILDEIATIAEPGLEKPRPSPVPLRRRLLCDTRSASICPGAGARPSC